MKHLKSINDLNERALDVEKYPETYLSQTKKGSAEFKKFSEIAAQIYQMFKELKWQDIKFETVSGSRRGSTAKEVPILPAALRAKIKKAFDIDSEEARKAFRKENRIFAKTWQAGDGFDNAIYMEVEDVEGHQRTHFPGGIPDSLRGYKLGYKLYRALLEKYKYLCSNTSGTTDKDRVWTSIISPKKDSRGRLTADDVHSMLAKDDVFAMVKNISNRKKIEHVGKFLKEIGIEDYDLTKKNLGVDDELMEILPTNIKDQLDPKKKEEAKIRKIIARLVKLTPDGVKNSRWNIGDYVVDGDEVEDLETDLEAILVRKVVSKAEDGNWLAIPLAALTRYERTGEYSSSDYRSTVNKTDWFKAKLRPGEVDPTAGRLAVAGTSAAERGQSANVANKIKSFMRYDDYDVWATSPDFEECYLTRDSDGRRKSMINTATGERTEGVTGPQLRRAPYRLRKLSTVNITHKTDLREGDHVFVKDHRRYAGKIFKVHRITPASNRQPGVYLAIPNERPLYISDMSSIMKIRGEIANDSLIQNFDEFTSLLD